MYGIIYAPIRIFSWSYFKFRRKIHMSLIQNKTKQKNNRRNSTNYESEFILIKIGLPCCFKQMNTPPPYLGRAQMLAASGS